MGSISFGPCLGILVFLAGAAFAKTEPQKTPAFREIIKNAQELTLDKERLKASELLIKAIRKESKDSVAHRELVKALESLSEVFYTEKAQQIYELGRVVFKTDPLGSISHFKEALKEDPNNVFILKSLARANLFLGDCANTLAISEEGLEVNPFSKDFALVKIQALACLKKGTEMKTYLASVETSWGPLNRYIEMAKAQVSFFEEKYDLAFTLAEKVKTEDPNFPEAYYWLGQVQKVRAPKQDNVYNRIYVKLCQEGKEKIEKKYEHEPRLCQESKAVEMSLEKSNPKQNSSNGPSA